MSIVRYAAIAATALFALMNLGVALGAEDNPTAEGMAYGALLVVLGSLATYGLVRDLHWGPVAGAFVGVVNLVGSIIGIAQDEDGGGIGVVVASVGIVLCLAAAASSGRQTVEFLAQGPRPHSTR